MQSKRGLVLLLFIFLLSGLRLSQAQQPSQCLAVITEINGEALLKKVKSSEFTKASWGTQLFQGDEIKTSDKSEVKLLFSNNNLISLGSNSKIKIAGKESPMTETTGNVRSISSAAMVNLSDLIPKREDKNDVGALAGLRSVSMDQSIELTAPNNTLIKTDRPSFSWITKKSFDNYVVNLYNSKGLVWSKKFSVLSLEKSKEVEENENTIRNIFKNDPESSSMHSVLGAYYVNKGLLQDAIIEFQTIAKLNIDAALPHALLGSLYSEVGDKDKAIDELQKALKLAKDKEK